MKLNYFTILKKKKILSSLCSADSAGVFRSALILTDFGPGWSTFHRKYRYSYLEDFVFLCCLREENKLIYESSKVEDVLKSFTEATIEVPQCEMCFVTSKSPLLKLGKNRVKGTIWSSCKQTKGLFTFSVFAIMHTKHWSIMLKTPQCTFKVSKEYFAQWPVSEQYIRNVIVWLLNMHLTALMKLYDIFIRR